MMALSDFEKSILEEFKKSLGEKATVTSVRDSLDGRVAVSIVSQNHFEWTAHTSQEIGLQVAKANSISVDVELKGTFVSK